jgi:hypothetical protein
MPGYPTLQVGMNGILLNPPPFMGGASLILPLDGGGDVLVKS